MHRDPSTQPHLQWQLLQLRAPEGPCTQRSQHHTPGVGVPSTTRAHGFHIQVPLVLLLLLMMLLLSLAAAALRQLAAAAGVAVLLLLLLWLRLLQHGVRDAVLWQEQQCVEDKQNGVDFQGQLDVLQVLPLEEAKEVYAAQGGARDRQGAGEADGSQG